jgi:hypothetical protein
MTAVTQLASGHLCGARFTPAGSDSASPTSGYSGPSASSLSAYETTPGYRQPSQFQDGGEES